MKTSIITPKKARSKFIDELQSSINEQILHTELAELRANSDIYNILDLKVSKGKLSIWGLIVITDKNIYFYAPQSQTTYFSVPVTQGDEEAKDQLTKISGLKNISISSPKSSIFTAIFLPEVSRTINISFTDQKDSSQTFTFILNNKAQSIMDLLSSSI